MAAIQNLLRDVSMRGTKANIEAFTASLEESAIAYATDTGELGIYTNGAWAWISPSVATDTIWDAKGDLAAGTGANTAQRLAVGANGQVIVADSTQTTGLRWNDSPEILQDDDGEILTDDDGNILYDGV